MNGITFPPARKRMMPALLQWKQKPSLKDILAGATLRIAVDDMEKYNHADICFDRFGRIHVQPLVVGSFQPSVQDTPPEPENEEPKVPSVVDVSVWYELVGQKVLESLITELNAGGHTRLTIKENGDVAIRQNKKELLKTTLENLRMMYLRPSSALSNGRQGAVVKLHRSQYLTPWKSMAMRYQGQAFII